MEQPLTEEIKQAERLKVQEELREKIQTRNYTMENEEGEVWYNAKTIDKMIDDITKKKE